MRIVQPSSSGGSSISDPNVAYVRSDGNDSTGTIGNPSLPYLTWQAAVDSNAVVFDFGVGSFGDVILAGNDFSFIGKGSGPNGTQLGSITSATGFTIQDSGYQSAHIGVITTAHDTLLTMSGVRCAGINGSATGFDNAASINLTNCAIENDVNVSSVDGNAGNVSIHGGNVNGNVTTTASGGGTPSTPQLRGIFLAGVFIVQNNYYTGAVATSFTNGAADTGT